MRNVPIVFSSRLFSFLVIGFIVATTVGVLSHEGGHYLAARYYGFAEVHMRYNSTSWQCTHSPCNAATERQHITITAAGPLQTILAGTLGIVLLFTSRNRFKRKAELNLPQWCCVFLALFWLREISNLLREFYLLNFTTGHNFSGDEFLLSSYFGWGPWLLSVLLGVLAVFILFAIIFVFVPARQRFTFMLSGLFGGVAGAVLWLGILGPRLMP